MLIQLCNGGVPTTCYVILLWLRYLSRPRLQPRQQSFFLKEKKQKRGFRVKLRENLFLSDFLLGEGEGGVGRWGGGRFVLKCLELQND